MTVVEIFCIAPLVMLFAALLWLDDQNNKLRDEVCSLRNENQWLRTVLELERSANAKGRMGEENA